jgi:N12 class adenine-specific DNA methylase
MPVEPHLTPALTEGKSLFKRLKGAGEHSVVGGTVTMDKLGRKWNASLHPRDSRGRFIETGGIVRTFNGRFGRVIRALGGPKGREKVLLQYKDGTRGEELANRLTMVRRPDGSLPTSSKGRVQREDKRRELDPNRGDGLKGEDHGDADGDGIPDHLDPTPNGNTAPGQPIRTVQQLKDHWKSGQITERLDGAEMDRLEPNMLRHKADHLASAQLSPKRSFIVGKLDNDPAGAWRVFHSRTGGLIAGDEESRLKSKKEALALARALEDMDVHGEKFDWDSPGVHDRMDRDEDGFHEALAQARDKAAADLAAQPPTRKPPVKPNATRPDGTPHAPDAPEQAPTAPEVAPALTDPRAQGIRDADRVWQHFHSDHDRARQQADQWDALAQADDDGNLTNGAERRAAAAARLRELLGDEQATPAPHGGENGAQAPEGAPREPVRPHRAEVLGDVPAEQGRSDSAGREGDVLPDARGAGGGRGGDADTRVRPERTGRGLPERGRGAGQGEEAGRGDGARRDGVPAEGAGDGGPRDGGRPAPAGDQGRVTPDADAVEAPARRFQPKGQGDLAPSSQKARVEANIEALKTLRALEAGDRPATEEEQRKLARWSGWGAIPDAVDPTGKTSRYASDEQRAEIARLLGEDGLKAARRNTLNAHYTDAGMVDAIWKAVEGLGFDGGVVLEPGAGSGNFIGHAPSNAHMIGVELDPVTAGIAHHLYPDASIRRESFGDTRMPEGSVDAVVGNVPFGRYAVSDARYNAKQQHNIHNHFIIKSLALTKPGGVVALLTSRYTMDAEDDKARREMAKYGDLVTAVRLPGGAHKKAAGTDVITDLLVFRRREDGQDPGGDQSWVESSKADVNGHEIPLNNYFQNNPGQVLGEVTTGRGQFSDHDLVVKGRGDVDKELSKTLTRAVQEGKPRNPNDGVRAPEDKRSLKERLASLLDAGSARGEGNIGHKDGKFTVVEDGAVVEHKVPKTQAEELRRLVTMRDLAGALLAEEAQHEQDTPRVHQLRKALNDAYDEYVREHGPINRFTWTTRKNPKTGEESQSRLNPGQGAFRKDPSSALVYALEKFDPETGTATKASIMTERVVAPRKPVEHADTPNEALAVVMDTHGRPDLGEVARLLGTDKKTARERLGRLVYDDPDDPERLITATEYLSGNVRAKLERAREAAAAGGDRFQANVDALEQVLPKDLLPGEIDGRLGAAWIGHEDVQQFLQEITGDRYLKVKHPGGSLWDVEGGSYGIAARNQYGTDRMPAGKLAQKLLQQKPIEVFDSLGKDANGRDIRKLNADATEAAQAKATELQERFSEWLWEDPKRAERLAKVYNEKFNSLVMRQGDSRERAMPGLASWFKPKVHGHQYAAVDRILNEPTALLDHVVGAGKTAEMVMGTQELRRLGLVKKPAIVIPNHMLEQFTREYLQLYPQAKLLAAGSDDLTGDKRRRFIARAATGDWDAVILTQKAFESIPMSAAAIQRYVDKETEALAKARERAAADATSKKDSTLKQTETRLANREAKLEKLVARTKDMDSALSFEQSGIDYLMVDEAHHFKNLSTPSSGAGAIDGSGRSTDLDSKLHYLREKAGERGRVATFATGTPIANSVAEQYVMTKYLRPDLLENAGIEDFDQWVGTFGEMVTDVEITNDGSGFKTKTRLAKFRNVPELLRMWGTFTDTKTADDLKLPTPDLVGGRPEMVEVVPTDAQRAAIAAIQLKMEGAKGGQFLRLFGMGRRAAQDLRLIKPEELEELASAEGLDEDLAHALQNVDLDETQYGSKLISVADRVAGIWEQNKDNVYVDPDTKLEQPTRGAAQIIFMDQGTPGDGPDAGRWNAYQALKDQLVERGVPAEKVRFVHEAKNDKQKAELFAAARDGRVAVLIGSTEKMGVGTNVQARAVALHHVDIPWRPADVEQREGRILRQGNQNADARILRYVTQQSFDAYSWQTIERKGRFIGQVKRGKIDVREMEDIGDAVGSFAVAKAAASGNPRLMEKAQVDEEVKRLGRLSRPTRRARTLSGRSSRPPSRASRTPRSGSPSTRSCCRCGRTPAATRSP